MQLAIVVFLCVVPAMWPEILTSVAYLVMYAVGMWAILIVLVTALVLCESDHVHRVAGVGTRENRMNDTYYFE